MPRAQPTLTRAGAIELDSKPLKQKKVEALNYIGTTLVRNMSHPHLTSDPFRLISYPNGQQYRTVPSHLHGEIHINAGFRNQELMRKLEDNVAQVVPWGITSITQPTLVQEGRSIIVSIPWPDNYIVDDVPLMSLPPATLEATWLAGRLVVGVEKTGTLITPQFTPRQEDKTSVIHMLVAGTTGMGKTVFISTMIGQIQRAFLLMQDRQKKGLAPRSGPQPYYLEHPNKPPSYTVILDGKGADGLEFLQGVPGLTGPIAFNIEDAQDALFWVYMQMEERRQEARRQANKRRGRYVCNEPPIYVFISEFDVFLRENEVIQWLVKQIARRGRSFKTFMIMDGQNTFKPDFGDNTIPDQLSTRIAFRTANVSANTAIMPKGCPLKSHEQLHRRGEAFFVSDLLWAHMLVPRMLDSDFDEMRGHAPALDEWPQVDVSKLRGYEGEQPETQRNDNWTPAQIAVAVHAAQHGIGWPSTKELYEQFGEGMGRGRDRRVRKLGAEINRYLDELGYCSIND